MKLLIQMFIDHKTLKIFIKNKQLTQWQVNYLDILFKFNFQIIFQSSKINIKINVLIKMFLMNISESTQRTEDCYQIILTLDRINILAIKSEVDFYKWVKDVNKTDELYNEYEVKENNHNARITNFEKKHYKQDRVNLEDDWTTMNCMNCSNADSKMIASDVDSSQENRDAKSKRSCDDEENVANIIDLLIKISTLEKEKNKDHSWKEIALKLIRRLRLDSEEKHHANQNAFIAKNVQKLKTSVQLLNKQLHTQRNTRLSTKITSWANVTRKEIATRKQRFRDDSSSLRKKREVMIKIMNRREIEKIQKKSIKQILQRIADVSTDQKDLIVSLHKLSSDNISLHAVSSDARANLKKIQTWAKEIASSTRVARRIFAMLTHEVRTTIDMSNQEKIIERLIKDNARLHEDLKVLRIVWLKKIADSEKTHSSLIVKIAIEAMMNRLMNVSMLNLYQECACKLFEKNCRITQCFRCHEFDHMTKICRKNQRCEKCADKHHIEKYVMSLNRRLCVNCNENHELWRRICLKWRQQMKQAFEIYRNRLFRYSKTSKYNHTLFSLSLNSLDSTNSSDSTNSFDSTNFSSSATVMLKTRSWIADESAWQIVEIKKRWVDLFSCVNSDSDEMTSEQIQKRSIRKWERSSMIKSIQRVFSSQSQQQLWITSWWNSLFYEFYSTTSENH